MLLPGQEIICLLLAIAQACLGQSSLILDWTFATPQDLPIKNFRIDYYPPIGSPIPNTTIPPTEHTLEINNTLSATDYLIILTATLETEDNKIFPIFNRTVPSSPDEPILEFVEANETEALVSFFPPDGDYLTYYLEYYPLDSVENAQFFETNSSLVTLEGLEPGTEYNLRIMTVYKGVPSRSVANTTFQTLANSSIIPSANVSEPYAKPLNVKSSREGRSLRISWDPPEDANCTGYRVNYTVTTLSVPKSFQKEVKNRTFLLIKFLEKHHIIIEVYCIADVTEISDEPGRAEADLREPTPIQHLRLAEVTTDEFFVSKVVLDWDWPEIHDFNKFTILVSYYPGKANGQRKDTVVHEKRPVKIRGLKPTELYTFLVRNISQVDIRSKVKGIRQIMPPIISSTLYPGEITSNSININYSPTDNDEARFEKYHFVFKMSETRNITQTRTTSDKSRSLTFTSLIPGKTYKVFLYTVYRSVRSRPVIASFTTYPLKVKSVLPVVRNDAVKLFWRPEESIATEIRYRISYSGSDGTESQPITLVNQKNYTFMNLAPETWFTFSITVVMGDAESESESITVVTGFARGTAVDLKRLGATKMEIGFRPTLFTESNGVVNSYAVVVAQDYELDNYPDTYSTWYTVQDQEVWKPYQASKPGYNPFGKRRDQQATFIIGDNSCDDVPGICNGPLKPATTYYIKLRACTKQDICMETDYTEITTQKSKYKKKSNILYLNSADGKQFGTVSVIMPLILVALCKFY